LFLNQKDLEKNNKEILKLHQLLNNKESKEEYPIKLEDNKSPKKLNFTKLNTKPPKELKSTPEETLN
jgi:hypothetical protein